MNKMLFDDDVYDLKSELPRWVVSNIGEFKEGELFLSHYQIVDLQTKTLLKAKFTIRDDAAEICKVLNQQQAEIEVLENRVYIMQDAGYDRWDHD